MKQKKSFILFLFLINLLNQNGIYGQKLELTMRSANKLENEILSKLNYQAKHQDSTSVKKEALKVSAYLKNKGYFLNIIDSINYKEHKATVYFSLKKKITAITLKIDSKYSHLFEKKSLNNNELVIAVDKLQDLLATISKKLDQEGKSFSTIQLQNITIINQNIQASLIINESKKRTIDAIEIKGYDNFSKNYLSKYLKIKKGIIFNEDVVEKSSNLLNKLNFIQEIKEPEVLFTEDSTKLYLYIKKKQNNSLDALVNFATKENGDFLLNGNINLELNNILNSGEQFKLFWNRIGEERQEFELSTKIPYIFKSKITSELNFSLYRQDSSFTNVAFKTNLFYNINYKNKISTFFSFENSENLETESNDILDFRNYFIGLSYEYKNDQNEYIKSNKFNLNLSFGVGQRKSNSETKQQYQIKSISSYLLELNSRNNIYLRNEIGILESKNYLINELYRIGGANSIRGFNEQSIFAEQYTYFNVEYRLKTSTQSYLYSITDLGGYVQDNKNNSLLSLGLGYLFGNDKYTINLALAAGKFNSEKFDVENTKFLISWINYF
ncbi:POTRA domain-containing protein [Polaribacter sp. MED152]|uniref:POTRA domain-containing protein n=1 Tax=Polaribacter sp. MED152 TaxID=313598 RepID=UPI0000689A96|nr:POTRA domain-containing protein [Polaribacter sp. MED152]EAQ40847.3 hypothetical protein MED152_12454 [Polaribacter sp. MED152]